MALLRQLESGPTAGGDENSGVAQRRQWEQTYAPRAALVRLAPETPAYATTYQDLAHAARILKSLAGSPPYTVIAMWSWVPSSTVCDFFTAKHVVREESVGAIIKYLLPLAEQKTSRLSDTSHVRLATAQRDWEVAIDRVYTAMRGFRQMAAVQ